MEIDDNFYVKSAFLLLQTGYIGLTPIDRFKLFVYKRNVV